MVLERGSGSWDSGERRSSKFRSLAEGYCAFFFFFFNKLEALIHRCRVAESFRFPGIRNVVSGFQPSGGRG